MLHKGTEITQSELSSAPSILTLDGIKEYLTSRGAKGVMDIWTISIVLGTATPRTLRRFVHNGILKPLNPNDYRGRIFSIDAVAEFLLQNPRYIAQRRQMWEITEDITHLVRMITRTTWQGLAKRYGEDDLVSEVHARLLNTPKQLESTVSPRTVINRILGKIYREEKRKPQYVAVSEDSFTGDDSDN